MTLLLHFSDPHFGTEQAPVCDALRALVHERRPDAAVLSGDVTQRARRAQFAAARAFCDSLPIDNWVVLPGNHDIPLFNVLARMTVPYAGYRRAFGPDLEPVVSTPQLLVVGVNTTRPARHKNGEVSREQVKRVARALRNASREQLRVVVTHQPGEVVRVEDDGNRLIGADDALHAWCDAGADLVLGGHIHLPYIVDLAQRPLPTKKPMWVVQAGTALSHRVRDGIANSVNLIHWEPPAPGAPRKACIERLDYDAERGAFCKAGETVLRLAG
jgi:3',5'-cyclic AMP phosphodiesterase CpdA